MALLGVRSAGKRLEVARGLEIARKRLQVVVIIVVVAALVGVVLTTLRIAIVAFVLILLLPAKRSVNIDCKYES